MLLHDVIIRPLITEKSMGEAGKGKFTFIVSNESQKEIIKKAIETKYEVNVTDVSTMYVKGKRKRVGQRRTEVRVTPYKKAIVTLRAGQKIALFELGA